MIIVAVDVVCRCPAGQERSIPNGKMRYDIIGTWTELVDILQKPFVIEVVTYPFVQLVNCNSHADLGCLSSRTRYAVRCGADTSAALGHDSR